MKKKGGFLRGHLARRSKEKLRRQRAKTDYTDLKSNTRKRRRIARRLLKEQPLFAFNFLCSHIDNYSYNDFIRDTIPPKKSPFGRSSKKVYTTRMMFHDELLRKLDLSNPENKIVTRLLLNWENFSKGMKIEKKIDGIAYSYWCPKRWSLEKVRSTFEDIQKLKTLIEVNEYWDKATSYGY